MNQTKFNETEALLAVLDGDRERLDQILGRMLIGELLTLIEACRDLYDAAEARFWELKRETAHSYTLKDDTIVEEDRDGVG